MFWGYAAAVHYRQHQPGASARQRPAGGDRAGDGRLRRALRLPVPLPRDSPPQSKSRRGAEFSDRRNQFPAGPHLREPGGSQSAGVRVGHGSHGASPDEQDALDSRQGLRARMQLSDEAVGPSARVPLPEARHGQIRIHFLRGQLLLDPREQAGKGQGAAIRRPFEDSIGNGPASPSIPADGVKDARFSPEGQPLPRYQPRHRKHGSRQEEQRLRGLGPEVAAYVDYALQTLGVQRHRFLRELFSLFAR